MFGPNPQNVAMRLSRRTVESFCKAGRTLCTAESCTGGLIAKLITDVSGSSAAFAGAFVTYTNQIKTEVLGVDANIIASESEVSEACAKAMAVCARERMHTAVAISTTGFAGPGGGNEKDPVGTVYIGVCSEAGCRCERLSLPADMTRRQIRLCASVRALELALEELERSVR